MSYDIVVPDLDDPDFKQEFADRSTYFLGDNVGRLMEQILIKYHEKFDGKENYRKVSDSIHNYQFLKMINSVLQGVQRFKHGLSKDMFRLSDEEFIGEVKKIHKRTPLMISTGSDPSTAVDGIIDYIKKMKDIDNNLN